jgi:hypothetical protein
LVGGGVRLPAFKTAAVMASLTASVPSEGVTSYLVRVGLSQASDADSLQRDVISLSETSLPSLLIG